MLGLAGLHADRGLSPDLLEERCPAPPLPDPAWGSARQTGTQLNDGEVALGGKYTKSNGANAVYLDRARFDPYEYLGGASSFFAPSVCDGTGS